MDLFAAMRVFRCVAESGSFTAAAERLDTTHSSISRQLRQLETHLGARLLDRNSRGQTPTEAGRAYLSACVDILARVEAAEHTLGSDQPQGELRVSVPLVIGTLELGEWLPGFLARYPQIQLNLSCDDRQVDLIGEGFDMALRIAGELPDSTLVARELAQTELVLVAAPAYVLRHGLPQQPADLAEHVFLGLAGAKGGARQLLFVRQTGEATQVVPNARFRTDAITALHAAVLAGQGVAAFTRLTVLGDLAAGRLVQVLPAHHAGQRRYWAVYPHARQLAPKVRALTDYLRAHYGAALPHAGNS